MDDYSLVQFALLDASDEQNVTEVLMTIDNAIQYGEDLEIKDRCARISTPENSLHRCRLPEEMEEEEERRHPGPNGIAFR